MGEVIALIRVMPGEVLEDNQIDKMIKDIKRMTETDKISVYIISHRLLESDYFNKIYRAENYTGFSKINLLKTD